MKKIKVVVLGSTGTIGQSTLSIIRHYPRRFKLLAISAHRNIRLLRGQIEEFHPQYAAISDSYLADKFSLPKAARSKILKGKIGVNKIAALDADIVVIGISGLAALEPLVISLTKAKKILLANKEVIIACGQLLRKKFPTLFNKIFPVDSELFSLWLLLRVIRSKELDSVYITASGGPFWEKSHEEMANSDFQEALKHPNWVMGKRISVDSATLMNKGFEIIETQNIFRLSLEKIKVLVHRQSFMHAFVKTKSGIFLGTMFQPDMKIPIGYGLGVFSEERNFLRIKSFPSHLDFVLPDYKRFPSLSLCRQVAGKGKSFPLVLVSADEAAVDLYLKKKINLTSIYTLVKKTLQLHRPREIKFWEDVYHIEEWAKNTVLDLAKERFN